MHYSCCVIKFIVFRNRKIYELIESMIFCSVMSCASSVNYFAGKYFEEPIIARNIWYIHEGFLVWIIPSTC